MKKCLFLIAGLAYCLGINAQNAQNAQNARNAPDSIFRNYLYDSRTSYFRQLPVKKGAFIFFGDSITHWGDWSEFTGYAFALNRGIAGDNTYGLVNRVDEVTRHSPRKVFILVGTNDINIHIPLAKSLENYDKLVLAIRRESPSTEIYIQSILPVNNELINRAYYTGTNEAIRQMNQSLDSLARKLHVVYVDLYTQFLDPSGQMDAAYTYDGLHLTGAGYLHWIGILKNSKFL
ncbi:MAG: GDSL-type esterase/lipase family protein [Puia sp.]|nr:GDSL-type esterase/lipase family protein [Puia sp.]